MPTKCSAINCAVEQIGEMPKSLSARVIVDLYPNNPFGLAGLLQG